MSSVFFAVRKALHHHGHQGSCPDIEPSGVQR